ncbi:MAG: acyltransferase [Flavobacterium sp.]|nr:acyltransferase [Flavobacterium sp.]
MKIIHKIYQKYLFHINRIRILKLQILGGKISKGVKSYGRFTVVNAPNLIIGENSIINEGVHINCRSIVNIGKDVHLSSNVQIHTGKLQIDKLSRIHSKAPITIENNVWLASAVIVLAGVKIGENSIVAAGSVVTKDIPANSLAMGIPAIVKRKI